MQLPINTCIVVISFRTVLKGLAKRRLELKIKG